VTFLVCVCHAQSCPLQNKINLIEHCLWAHLSLHTRLVGSLQSKDLAHECEPKKGRGSNSHHGRKNVIVFENNRDQWEKVILLFAKIIIQISIRFLLHPTATTGNSRSFVCEDYYSHFDTLPFVHNLIMHVFPPSGAFFFFHRCIFNYLKQSVTLC